MKVTLVIYIPFNKGALMVSDRKNTLFDDEASPIDKIIPLPNFNAVLGFAGGTDQCKHLINRLKDANASSLIDRNYIDEYLKHYNISAFGYQKGNVELLVVKLKLATRELQVYKSFNAFMSEESVNKCLAIGSGAKFIRPHLVLNTLKKTKEQAEKFGSALLAYASMCGNYVGNPASYGYNVVIIEDAINPVLTRSSRYVSIDRLLYKFDE